MYVNKKKSYKGVLVRYEVQAETCSIHVKVSNWLKINLSCVRLNKCGLFSNKHKRIATIKINIQYSCICRLRHCCPQCQQYCCQGPLCRRLWLVLHKQGACRTSGGAHKHLPLSYAPGRCFRHITKNSGAGGIKNVPEIVLRYTHTHTH